MPIAPPNFEPSEEKKIIDRITMEVQTYIRDWLLKSYPDFGRKWSELHQEAMNETKKLKDVIHNLGKSYEASYRDSGERFKKEIHEFLSKEHPIFAQLTNLSSQIAKVTEESSASLREIDKLTYGAKQIVENMEEKEKSINSVFVKLTSRSSIYEDIYMLREQVEGFSAQLEKFTSAFKNAFAQPEKESEDLSTSILELEFSVRTTNILSQAGIETVKDLLEYPEAKLLKFRNFGRKCLFEIQQFKKSIGK